MKSNGSSTVIPAAGAMARQEFGATQLEVRAETSSTAMAAYAQATVQARFIMAERKPRNIERARFRILDACKRPRFADEAIYNKPIGDGIEGPSIRLAEALVRELGNISVDVTAISDDQDKRVLSIVATDLESNATYSDVAVVEKTVERHNPAGYDVLGQRTNKWGKTIYIVRATDDDILNKQAAVVSKKIRTATLRLVPADILEEAMDQCRATLEAETIKDLPGVRSKVIAAFGTLKPPIPPEELSKYLGKDVARASPAEVVELKKIGTTLRDGEATWKEVIDLRLAQRAQAVQTPPPPVATQAAQTSAPATTAPPAPAAAAAETAQQPSAERPGPSSETPAAHDPTTGEVQMDPAEVALDAAITGAKSSGELMKLLKSIKTLAAEKQPAWRERFNRRMEELANANAQ